MQIEKRHRPRRAWTYKITMRDGRIQKAVARSTNAQASLASGTNALAPATQSDSKSVTIGGKLDDPAKTQRWSMRDG